MDYTVHSVEQTDPDLGCYRDKTQIKFTVSTIRGTTRTSFIDLSRGELRTYEAVSNQHYCDGDDIIVIRDIQRTMVLDNDGSMYRRASQCDYDRWMSKKFPESFNAAVYNTLNGSFGI